MFLIYSFIIQVFLTEKHIHGAIIVYQIRKNGVNSATYVCATFLYIFWLKFQKYNYVRS
jgi:hypothetical protein